MFKQRRKRGFLILLITVILAGLVPIETQISPSWKVQVLGPGPKPKPLPGCRVRQSWEHYTFDIEGGEEDKQTDLDGYVEFPPRSIRASFLRRLIGAILNLRDGIHAGFGPESYLVVSCQGYETELVEYSGQGQPQEKIVLRPRNE